MVERVFRAPAVAAPAHDPAATGREPVRAIVKFGLYLLVASIPFELPSLRGNFPVEVPEITAAIFLITTTVNMRRSYGRVPVPVWWFFGYLGVFLLAVGMNFMTSAFGVTQLFLLILQNVLVFWAASNILDDETVATGMLFSFGTSTFLRAICQLTGIGRDMHKVWTGGYRITAFGQNENNAAIIMGTGVLVLVGLAYARRAKPPFQPRWVVLPCCALIANASLQTGSRGGLIALLAGLAMFALSKGQRAWQYVRNVVVAGVAVVVLAFGANEVPMMRYRIHDTEREGRMAGREELYPLLVQMFKDKPIIGWGPDNSHYELSLREQNVTIMNRDSHNLILEVLTNSGIIGGVVFCTGLVLCGAASWKARGSREGVLPLATFACVLMGNMSGNWMSSKLLWMALAYAVGSARRVPQPVRRGKPRSRSLHPESAVV